MRPVTYGVLFGKTEEAEIEEPTKDDHQVTYKALWMRYEPSSTPTASKRSKRLPNNITVDAKLLDKTSVDLHVHIDGFDHPCWIPRDKINLKRSYHFIRLKEGQLTLNRKFYTKLSYQAEIIHKYDVKNQP